MSILDPGNRFLLIAGPCLLEDDRLNISIAEHVQDVAERLRLTAIFKASFDKANRTSAASPRGPGLEEGMDRLQAVRRETGLPVITDIHESGQAELVAGVVDAIQIPAFLCRQTDLLTAAGRTGLPVNIKKGQWLAPEDMRHPVQKVREAGAGGVSVTERGTAFGYGRWVVDMRSFAIMRETCDCRALFDATHSVQLPGGGEGGALSGGEPRWIETLARAAVAAGADGVFVETHPDPATAPSDGANMLPMARLQPLLESLLSIRQARHAGASEAP
ncbi:MAG: 3-deoxy-8-phosphooctulonate synthase [Candidatus Palauibacterales bacterium]|nr:3-deoxy-8-phosphooctulonate synthase [Candidatus Palauibacterales bacterium]